MILPSSLNNMHGSAQPLSGTLNVDEATFQTWLDNYIAAGGIKSDVWAHNIVGNAFGNGSSGSVLKNVPRVIVQNKDL